MQDAIKYASEKSYTKFEVQIKDELKERLQEKLSGYNQRLQVAIGESGQDAGKMELVKITLDAAREYTEKLMSKSKKELNEEVPDFDKNFKTAQKKAGMGKTVRKDMPVINDKQVKSFQAKLAKGEIDVNTSPNKAPETPKSNPFPEGLTGEQAEKFIEAGLKSNDGDAKDDIVKASMKKIKVKDLKPIQKQIYFDKSIAGIADFGADASRKFLSGSNFIASSDLALIDGHHRFLAAMLLDPDMIVPVLVIDMPIKDLLPLTKAYGDAIGNKRNA